MQLKFTINTQRAETDTKRVIAIVEALAGVTDSETGDEPQVTITNSSIEIIGSESVRTEARRRLDAVGLS